MVQRKAPSAPKHYLSRVSLHVDGPGDFRGCPRQQGYGGDSSVDLLLGPRPHVSPACTGRLQPVDYVRLPPQPQPQSPPAELLSQAHEPSQLARSNLLQGSVVDQDQTPPPPVCKEARYKEKKWSTGPPTQRRCAQGSASQCRIFKRSKQKIWYVCGSLWLDSSWSDSPW